MIDLHLPGLDFLGIANSHVAYLNVWDWADSEWPKNSAFSYVSHWIFCNDFWVFSGTGKVAVCWWTGVWSLCKSPVGSPQCSLQNLLPVSERLICSTSFTGFISNYPDNCSTDHMDSTLHNSWSYTRDSYSKWLSVSLWVEAANGLSSWGSLFKPLGTIHERVLFWEALDAFMFVDMWCGVTREVPVEAYIQPLFLLFRRKAFDVLIGWVLAFLAQALNHVWRSCSWYSPASAFLALLVKHWLKSEVSIADQSLLSVASAFWR